MVLRGLLEICERELVEKSHVGWSFLLLGSEECKCVLCHVDRSALLERPAWKRVKECYLAFL